MSYVLKKFLSAFLFLFLILGSFCMSLGSHASAFDSHEHNNVQSQDNQETTGVSHHHWDESVDCCNDLHEWDSLVVNPNIKIDFSETTIYDIDIFEQDIDYTALNTLKHQVFPNAPPEDIKRRESEKKSTQLII